MESIIEFSHSLLKNNLSKDDVVIDMTVGNGRDTLFLVENFKFVYGFDIQEIACKNTLELIKDYNNHRIIIDSHLNFDNYVNEEFAGVIFNLGYLPKGDKEIHTDAVVVLDTLEKVLKKIKVNGICVIVLYPGFASGLEEANLLTEYISNLNQKEYDALKYEFINQVNRPPFLIAIKRRI